MRDIEKVINMSLYTDEGRQKMREAYGVIDKIDMGLDKNDLTILNNFLDEHLFEALKMLRKKEYEMHNIRLK